MPKICSIIPMYGHAEMTRKCVDLSLKNAGMDIDIVVVDDGSPEPFQYHDNDHVFVHRLDKNSGYTNATNQGILWCRNRYDYVHLLNNDTEPQPNFVKYLYDALKKDPQIAVACSARLSDLSGESRIEYCAFDLFSGYQRFTSKDLDDDIVYCIWVPVCSALIPMDAMLSIGLLDKRMRNHCSDNDWCVRAHQLGYRVAVVPKSKVIHYHQVTTGKENHVSLDDQKILMEKVSCSFYSEAMKMMPLDGGENVWGEIQFRTYRK